MLKQRFYYLIKPLVPWSVRMFLRRIVARHILKTCQHVWPIKESAGSTPVDWNGWPGGKKFAVILTHDVEGPEGLAKCRQLAELEMELGFRSSFNFIPEGTYRVPAELRNWLVENRFEVGVHDLNHDGKLFHSRKGFARKAATINRYLSNWQASGYRSGFMLRNFHWLHDLNIVYDASTFDTDPFEPQPDGADTIFPYWISATNSNGTRPPTAQSANPLFGAETTHPLSIPESHSSPQTEPVLKQGFVELPYTLPQDSTLFLVLKEKSPEIWLRKLDWIQSHSGMALVNVHPDYIQFDSEAPSERIYPVGYYRQFLEYIRTRYQGAYWHALPKDVAGIASENHHRLLRTQESPAFPLTQHRSIKIWIDLENTPHIPFFQPIIKELNKRGHTVVLTARDAYQTCEMADLYGLQYQKIGHHYGKRMFLKAWGLGVRVIQLIPYLWSEKPALALNHGARAQTILCNLFRVPSVTIMDYEHTAESGKFNACWSIFPEVVANNRLDRESNDKLLSYAGIKEDVYAPELKPNPAILQQLRLLDAKIIITVRPPANEAHYHNHEADVLFSRFMDRAVGIAGVKVVLLPRNKRQEALIRAEYPRWFRDSNVIIPDTVVDGMNLLWHSDLVVSGGGTMNREAAALGVPVYSIFRGTIGAVDHYLQSQGRLTLIENVEDVDKKIIIAARSRGATVDSTPRKALFDIVNHIEFIINRECTRHQKNRTDE